VTIGAAISSLLSYQCAGIDALEEEGVVDLVLAQAVMGLVRLVSIVTLDRLLVKGKRLSLIKGGGLEQK